MRRWVGGEPGYGGRYEGGSEQAAAEARDAEQPRQEGPGFCELPGQPPGASGEPGVVILGASLAGRPPALFELEEPAARVRLLDGAHQDHGLSPSLLQPQLRWPGATFGGRRYRPLGENEGGGH